jgi:protein-S-isoprenylcysteine O-methyltransferase Ste14
VITDGPYRWIRHPGYAGALMTYVVTPFLLDTYWATITVFYTILVLVIRTSLEDNALKKNLEGYLEYSRKTKYRLLPGIW